MRKNHKALLAILLFSVLTACETAPTIESPPPVQEVKITQAKIILSAEGINNPSKTDILFAQSSLRSLGYPVGVIDGIWGKQSASALIKFERTHNIESANGQLSSLNLYTLRNTKQTFPKAKKKKEKDTNQTLTNTTIASKLSSETPKKTPTLIIIEQDYPLMSKANPYSHVVTQLESGTGIYILSMQNGWYEVETLSKQQGFIKEN